MSSPAAAAAVSSRLSDIIIIMPALSVRSTPRRLRVEIKGGIGIGLGSIMDINNWMDR